VSFGGRREDRMRVVLLDSIHHPPGEPTWHLVETPSPDWPTIEAAIRRLDRKEWPFVWLHTVEPVDEDLPDNALRVMGGYGEYLVSLARDGGEIFYDDPTRGEETVAVWEHDQSGMPAKRSCCSDIERVLLIARHFAEFGELHPSASWVEV
jgi:hypothetical protein